jgi:hypothetical protein
MKLLIKTVPRIILLIAVLLFAAYTVFGFFILPNIIKSEAVDYIKKEFNRDTEIGSVTFNPFTFKLGIYNFILFEKEKKERFISFNEFRIDISLLPLISKEIDIEEIVLTGPAGNVIRLSDSLFNFSDMIKESHKPGTTKESSGPVRPGGPAGGENDEWEIYIRKFELTRLSLLFSDRTVSPPGETRIDSFSVTVTNLHFNSSDTSDFDLSSKLRRGGTFSLSGNFSMNPLKANLKYKFDSASLIPFTPYISDFSYLRLDGGKLNLDGTLVMDGSEASKPIKIDFEANSSITDLKLFDTRLNERFLEWSTLSLSGIKGKLNPLEVKVNKLDLTGLYSRIAIAEDTSFNVSEILKSEKKDSVEIRKNDKKKPVEIQKIDKKETAQIQQTDKKQITPEDYHDTTKTGVTRVVEKKSDTTRVKGHVNPMETPGKQEYSYEITEINIIDGEMYYSDLSLPLKFGTKIHNLNGNVTGFSSNNPLGAEIKLEGTVDEYGMAKIKGKIDPFQPMAYSDIKINFHNIELTSLSPYSVRFLGYYIEQGKLSLDIAYKIKDGILSSYNKIFLNKFTLGDEVEGEEGLGLPIKLALALLKDADDNIDLDLEVEGDLNDPETDTGALIWWAVKRVLTTIVTAPFRFLGGLLGIGGEDLESVDFEVGSAELENHQYEKMMDISKIMGERPGIVLEIYGTVDTVTDARAIREQKFEVQYNQNLFGDTGVAAIKNRKDFDQSKGTAVLENMFVKTYSDSILSQLKNKYQIGSSGGGTGNLRDYLDTLKEQLITAQQVSGAEFQQLAAKRAEAISNHMMTVHHIPETRITIMEIEILENEDRTWTKCRLGIGSLD